MTLEEEMEKAFQQYTEAIEKIADRVFRQLVKPYLDAHQFSLKVVNGEWWLEKGAVCYWVANVGYSKDRRDVYDDLLGKSAIGRKIFEALQTGIPGYHASLGMYMPCYDPMKAAAKEKTDEENY